MTNKYTTLSILLVEDNRYLRAGIKDMLEDSGYIVYEAGTKEEAIKTFNDNADILFAILDLRLPDGNGLDVATYIRELRPYVQFMIMTAYATTESAIETLRLGGLDFIQKPFELNGLFIIIRKCLRILETDKLVAAFAGKIFLSYAREDEKLVAGIYDGLKLAGYDPWMDLKNITPGEKWNLSIENAIKSSSFFLACLSKHSVNKRGMIQKELRMAFEVCDKLLDSDIYFIPVLLETVEVPERIKNFQWVEYFEEDGWDKLIGALRAGLERRIKK